MSAPDYSGPPIKGMGVDPPRYNAIVNPPMSVGMSLLPPPQTFPAPQQTAIMPYMDSMPGVPRGLEYLTQLDQVLVQEKFSSTQGYGRKYEILNSLGQRMFLAKQEIACCGPRYDLNIMDNNNQAVMELLVHCACSCTSDLEIHCPPGKIIGHSLYTWNNFVTSLSIQNQAKQPVLVIVGPSFQTNIFGNVNFEVKSSDETQTVGMIRRDNDHFSVQFPLDLDVKIKAVLIGSCFFLDQMVYDRRRELVNRPSNTNSN